MHGEDSSPDRGRRRSRLPQLQPGLPRRPGVRRSRFHRHADSEHRRPSLPRRAGGIGVSQRHPDPARVCVGGARREHEIDIVVFAYSDVTHEHVMHIGSRALAAGASFELIAPRQTMLASSKPAVAICAVRTGSGKSQTTRRVAEILRDAGKRVAVLRHPMPYGDLAKQAVQRFERYEDLEAADATIEEREEYEPHLAAGNLVFAGIDYERILRAAEQEADVILWDGGNNDTPFIKPDLHIVVVDPHHPGHELRYHPAETNLRMADVCVVNKMDSAAQEGIDAVLTSIHENNADARIVLAASPFHVEGDPQQIAGKRVLAGADGP